MSRRIADLLIKIGADSYEFQQAARTVEKNMAGMAKSFDRVGKELSLKLTAPLAALGVIAVRNYDVQVQAEAKLLRALNGREDVMKRLAKQASELQAASTIGDEPFMQQQAYFATLGLTEKQIKDATRAAMEMSYAFKDQGMTFETASKYIGQMYGGTVGRLGMLIPQLKEFTKEQLKHGDAVKYMLSNYSGFAEKAAKEGLGPLTQLKNQWGDLLEEFGAVMMPFVQKLTGHLSLLVAKFQALTPETKQTIVGVGAATAAIGPLVLGVGALLGALRNIIAVSASFKAAFAAISATAAITAAAVMALAAGLGYVWYQRKKMQDEMVDKFSNLSVSSLEKQLAENRRLQEINENESLWQGNNLASKVTYAAGYYGRRDDLRREEKALLEAISRRKQASDEAAASENRAAAEMKKMLSQIGDSFSGLTEEASKPTGILAELGEQLKELENKKMFAKTARDVQALNKEIDALKDRILLINKGTETFAPVLNGTERAIGNAPAIDMPLSLVPSDLNEQVAEATDTYTGALENFRNSINNMCASFTVEGFAMIGDMIGSAIGGALNGGSALETLGNFFSSFLTTLGTQLITFGTTILFFQKSIASFLSNIWNPVGAVGMIASGTALIAVASAIKSSISQRASAKTPKLATGGLAFGPTYALVGDNRNAGVDPEVIAPLSKLKNMLGGGAQSLHITGEFRVRGNDLALTLERNGIRNNSIK